MRREALLLARHYLFSLGGEALLSGFHFALNLILIRTQTAYDYGLFAIIFILGGIALTFGNAVVSVPAAVHIPKLRSRRAAAYADVMFGSAALAISLTTAIGVAAGLALTTAANAEALAGGAFVGMWTLRNHIRAAMFARGATAATAVSDFSYAASGSIAVAIVLLRPASQSQLPLLLWGLAAAHALAILIAFRTAGAGMRLSFRRGMRRRYRALWSQIAWSVAGVATWNVQGQALMFLVAAFAGPAGYAPIAAVIVLFNPPRIAVHAFTNVVRPDFASGLAQGQSERVRRTLLVSVGISALCWALYAGAIWLAWDVINTHLYRDKFAQVSMGLVAILAGLTALASVSYHVPQSLTQAAHDFRTAAVATTFGAVVALSSIFLLLQIASVEWSPAGSLAGELCCAAWFWAAALRVVNEARRRQPAADRAAIAGAITRPRMATMAEPPR